MAGLQMIPTPIQVPKMGMMAMGDENDDLKNSMIHTDQITAGMYQLSLSNFEPEASRSEFGVWSFLES